MSDDTLRAALERAKEHSLCGQPTFTGCFAHFTGPHCRADGLPWPCDVESIRAALATEERGAKQDAAAPAEDDDFRDRYERAMRAAGEHEPHSGNHDGYACGFSGPHCWECGEPWPCRAIRGEDEIRANIQEFLEQQSATYPAQQARAALAAAPAAPALDLRAIGQLRQAMERSPEFRAYTEAIGGLDYVLIPTAEYARLAGAAGEGA